MRLLLGPQIPVPPARPDDGTPQADVRKLRGGRFALAVPALAALLAAGGSAQDVVGWGIRVFHSSWTREPFAGIAAGGYHTVARRSDGSVVAWGWNADGQANVPALPPGLTYVEVAADDHTVARRSDGSVVAWGDNSFGQCNVPALPPGLTWVEVAAGSNHTVARRSDGSVVAWGDNSSGQCNVSALPTGLTYVEVAAGGSHTVARRSDGSVVAWGRRSNVPALPPGLTWGEIDAGYGFTVARTQSGLFVTFAPGCPGSLGVPSLTAADPPRVGQTMSVTLV